MKPDDVPYLTKTKLKLRGWTDGKILEIFPTPDKTARNPHGRSAPLIKLYIESKVIAAENTEEWKKWSEKTSAGRKLISEKGKIRANNKRDELVAYVKSLTFSIPKFEKLKLYKTACQHYNMLWSMRDDPEKSANINADKEFLNRISVNMLRHEFSDYDDELGDLFGQIGKDFAYIELKNLILTKIMESYPYLAHECRKQMI